MPPKGASKKTVEKAKTKAVEDKTFGLKNKNKSKKVEQFVKSVERQVKKDKVPDFIDPKKKKEEEERKKLEAELFKPAVTQAKAPLGVDPKSVLCEFFKVGMCTKGNKCKFSHDLQIARKAEKIDIYTDRRKLEDTMDTWDQEKLESVVKSKEKEPEIKTKIVCKFFLDAIESKKYGWFWDCPNGGDKCMYQHALPPGFVLKSKAKEEENDEEEVLLEDILEEERAKLTKRTPLTLELFLKWKEDKKKSKEAKIAAEIQQAKKDSTDSRANKAMRSGRALFTFNPDLFMDDEDADVVDLDELPQEDRIDGPIIELDVTGTSIRTTITNAGKEEQEEDVQEDLFVEDDIPDISDDEGDGADG